MPEEAARPLRVLVVDDVPDVGELFAMGLTMEGFDVTYACGGHEALELAQRDRFDIAILDLGMPDIDGYETGQRLRMIPSCTDMPLIALSGYGLESDRQKTRECGFGGHLVKPATLADVRDMIAALVSRVS